MADFFGRLPWQRLAWQRLTLQRHYCALKFTLNIAKEKNPINHENASFGVGNKIVPLLYVFTVNGSRLKNHERKKL